MTVLPFSEALRSRTWADHGDSEGAGFMRDLMGGRGTLDDYIAMVAQHYFIYEALEGAEQQVAGDPVASLFLTDKLTRLPALENDLEFLIGADWRQRIAPLPSARKYVARIREVAANWPAGFLAHHYTRYLGDLSGGQTICRVMQKRFGFDTGGVSFYLFSEIADASQFKNTYRDQLDAIAWSADEQEKVIQEVIRAYRFNTDLFTDLAAARKAVVT